MSPPRARFSSADDAALQAVEIGQHQLGLDRLDVGDRIDPALDMGDVRVLEAAHDMGDGVAFADVGEELVAEALALGGAAHQAGDVDEGQPRRDDLGRAADAGERVEAPVRHGDVADVRLDGAERVVRRLRRGRLRQRVEEGRLADVRQADDAALEAQGSYSFRAASPGRFTSAQPRPSMARWTLFWKPGSSPLASSAAWSAQARQRSLDPGLLGLGEVAQHVGVHQRLVARMPDADPHAPVVVAALAP